MSFEDTHCGGVLLVSREGSLKRTYCTWETHSRRIGAKHGNDC